MSDVFAAVEAAQKRIAGRLSMVEFKAMEIADKLLAGEQPSDLDLKVYASFKQDHADAVAEYRKSDAALNAWFTPEIPTKEPSAFVTTSTNG